MVSNSTACGGKSFNSTLVQLKVKNMDGRLRTIERFQFYLSSIKSGWGQVLDGLAEMFQFYLSSIKSAAILHR